MQMWRGPSTSHQRRLQTTTEKQTKIQRFQPLIARQSLSSKTQGNQGRLSHFAKQPVCMSACGGVRKEKNNRENRDRELQLSVFI